MSLSICLELPPMHSCQVVTAVTVVTASAASHVTHRCWLGHTSHTGCLLDAVRCEKQPNDTLCETFDPWAVKVQLGQERCSSISQPDQMSSHVYAGQHQATHLHNSVSTRVMVVGGGVVRRHTVAVTHTDTLGWVKGHNYDETSLCTQAASQLFQLKQVTKCWPLMSQGRPFLPSF